MSHAKWKKPNYYQKHMDWSVFSNVNVVGSINKLHNMLHSLSFRNSSNGIGDWFEGQIFTHPTWNVHPSSIRASSKTYAVEVEHANSPQKSPELNLKLQSVIHQTPTLPFCPKTWTCRKQNSAGFILLVETCSSPIRWLENCSHENQHIFSLECFTAWSLFHKSASESVVSLL